MSTFGTTPSGFSRKPLTTILSEIEQANIDQFGPGVIQTAVSPLGQWNGLRADLAAELWEIAEDVYQSIDPDQAEGVRLDILANLRLITRHVDESDLSLRQAITNVGTANTRDADFLRALLNLDGVTWARVYSNDTHVQDSNGLAPHSIAVAVLGGSDSDIAYVIRDYAVPGIGTSGNVVISTVVDGYCRTQRLVRPTEIPTGLYVTVARQRGTDQCPPPSVGAIGDVLFAGLSGANRLGNGEALTLHTLRTIIAQSFTNVEILDAMAGPVNGTYTSLPLNFSFFDMALIDRANIEVVSA